jgi:TatD DNase family protein
MDDVRANMAANAVSHALLIGVNRPDYPAVRALAEQYDNFYATVGVHPDVQDSPDFSEDELVAEAQHPKVVGIGETGLDYYWCKGDLEWQRERFRRHIRAARRSGLPLVIHTRESAQDTLAVMREAGAEQAGGVMHCFTESWEVAEGALELGFYISFSGIVTFKNATALKEVARRVPLERLLVETDSPYLAPMPHRGKTNEPAYVRHVAAHVAELRGMALEDLAAASTDNFFTLFAKASRGH